MALDWDMELIIEKQYGNFNIAAYSTDSFGGSARFQLPISEIESLGLSLSVDQTRLATNFLVQDN